MDPNSLPEHMRKYFNAAANPSFLASFAAMNQVRPCLLGTKLIFFLIFIPYMYIRTASLTTEIIIISANEWSHNLFCFLQTPPAATATSETAGSPSPTGAEGLLLAAAHLGSESPVDMDGCSTKPRKGGKKPRRSAVNIVYGRKSQKS